MAVPVHPVTVHHETAPHLMSIAPLAAVVAAPVAVLALQVAREMPVCKAQAVAAGLIYVTMQFAQAAQAVTATSHSNGRPPALSNLSISK
jgi:hypothetical protein